MGEMAGPLEGPGGTLVGLADGAKWAQGSLPRPLASMCPYLSPFYLFLLKLNAYK